MYIMAMIDEEMQKEMEATALELSGAPESDVVGALAGTLIAAFGELFARVRVLEQIVLKAEPTDHAAEIIELPVSPESVGQVVVPAPVVTTPPEGMSADAIPLIEPPAPTSRDEMLRRRQVAASGPVVAPPAEVAAPSSELDRLRLERQALEARVRELRQRMTGAIAAVPIIAPSVVAPVAAMAPQAVYTGPLPFEIRHTDGPLIGRADMVGFPLEHATIEAAQAGLNLIAASKPGWRDRLAIFDRRLP